jgi:hypothetical protein
MRIDCPQVILNVFLATEISGSLEISLEDGNIIFVPCQLQQIYCVQVYPEEIAVATIVSANGLLGDAVFRYPRRHLPRVHLLVLARFDLMDGPMCSLVLLAAAMD